MKKVVIVGAGFGGLATAAELARHGLDVTVLEAHVYPGGCAGTFFHQGYRFDAGATLAGGFAPGAPMHMLGQHFGIDWEARPSQRAMLVHLPDGSAITRWTNPDRWRDERQQHTVRLAVAGQAQPRRRAGLLRVRLHRRAADGNEHLQEPHRPAGRQQGQNGRSPRMDQAVLATRRAMAVAPPAGFEATPRLSRRRISRNVKAASPNAYMHPDLPPCSCALNV